MQRFEQLKALADVLRLASEKALKIAPPEASHGLREIALAKQIEGISMEYQALASAETLVKDKSSQRDNSNNANARIER